MAKKIKFIYCLQNDHVVVFDEEGQPLRQYTGAFKLVKDRVLKDVRPDAEFYISVWGQGNFEKVTEEQWTNYGGESE